MRLFLTLLLLALVSCIPAEAVQPRLHDLALYNLNDSSTLYSYFYGSATSLQTSDEQTLVLTEPVDALDDSLSVSGTLEVNGQAYLSTPLPTLEAPFRVSRLQFSSDLKLEVFAALEAVVFFDGSMWFTLAEEVRRGFDAEVVPLSRFEGMRNLGALSFREAAMLENLLEPLAPVAIGILTDNPAPQSSLDGLAEYRRTGLYIQHDFSVTSSVQPPSNNLFFETIAKGNNAGGSDGFSASIATSPVSFNRLWGNAYANQLNLPAQPQIDYGRESIIAIFLGRRSSGGYGIEVTRVSQEGTELYVDVKISEPAPGGITTQAFTNPWLMIRVSEPNLRAAWIRDADERDLLGIARSTF